MQNARLDEEQFGIKIARRNINNHRYVDDTILMPESEEEPKSLWRICNMTVEKSGLKCNIQKMKIIASSPITSWQINGENVETVSEFIFLGSKINADNDCSHEIKKALTSWKNSYDKPRQYIKNQRQNFADKALSSQSYSFSSIHVWMGELDHKGSWVTKNWCFWTVVLEKTLESLGQRSNQSILREINPEYSLEVLMLKLKLQYFG